MRPLTPVEIAQREANRAASLTGTWRARGTDPRTRDVANALILMERSGVVTGTDTDARGMIKGRVFALADGQRVVRGYFVREDGRKGAFAWMVTGKGAQLRGQWKDADGSAGIWEAIKQGDGVSRDLLAFLKKRQWQASRPPQRANAPASMGPNIAGGLSGLGSLSGGVEGLTYAHLKVGGVNVGKVPSGFQAKGPGGSEIKVNRKGVQVKPPSIERLIEDVTGGGSSSSKPAPPSAPVVDEAGSRSKRVLYGTLAAAGVAVVVALVAVFRRKGPVHAT